MNMTTKEAKRNKVFRWPAYGLALLLAGGLAACSGGSNDGAPASATAPSSGPPQTSSASPSGPSASPAASPTSEAGNDAALLEAFKEQAQSDLSAAELNKALDDKLAQASPETGDALLREMLAYYDRSLPGMEKKLEAQNVQQALQKLEWPPTSDQIGQIKDEQARSLVQEAIDGGYKLETTEGFYFPVVDYGKLKRTDPRVTAVTKDYVALLAVESDQKSASDGGSSSNARRSPHAARKRKLTSRPIPKRRSGSKPKICLRRATFRFC